jgi:hypothetical protein
VITATWEKKIRGNTEPEREKKMLQAQPSEEKGMVIHH